MKHMISIGVAVLTIAMAMPAGAQSKQATAHASHHPAATEAARNAIDVPTSAHAAVQVVDAFGKALASGDFAQVESLLAPDVIILETGGAERSRAEYLGHHAKSDAKFLGGAHVALQRRTARTVGDVAWVASESEVHAMSNGKAVTLLSTESMVLNNTAEGWRIAHIHWSSRPKKTAGAK